MIWQLEDRVRINQEGRQRFSNVISALGIDEGIIKDVWDTMLVDLIIVKFTSRAENSLTLEVSQEFLDNLELEHQ